MTYKWIGAILIVCGCSLVGFFISAAYRRDEREIQHLIATLDFMSCELEYRITPLPDLCRQIAASRGGYISNLFQNLAGELDAQICPDVQSCLAVAAAKSGQISSRLEEAVCMMGSCFGRFDLDGQLQGIESVREYCKRQLLELSNGRDARLRSYQTLGICAGAALAILLV